MLSFLSTYFVLLQHSPFVIPTGIDSNVVVAPLLAVSTFMGYLGVMLKHVLVLSLFFTGWFFLG